MHEGSHTHLCLSDTNGLKRKRYMDKQATTPTARSISAHLASFSRRPQARPDRARAFLLCGMKCHEDRKAGFPLHENPPPAQPPSTMEESIRLLNPFLVRIARTVYCSQEGDLRGVLQDAGMMFGDWTDQDT